MLDPYWGAEDLRRDALATVRMYRRPGRESILAGAVKRARRRHPELVNEYADIHLVVFDSLRRDSLWAELPDETLLNAACQAEDLDTYERFQAQLRRCKDDPRAVAEELLGKERVRKLLGD